MTIRRKARLFYQLSEQDFRYVAWFELRGRDFYWGPAAPVPDIEGVSFTNATSIDLTFPKDLDELPRASWKASRHASGMMHVNTNGTGSLISTDVYVGSIEGLHAPYRFAALLDKQPMAHDRYTRSLNRGGCAAMILRLRDDRRRTRHHLEFFLSPAGSFPAPPPMLHFEPGIAMTDKPLVQSLDAELDVALLVRVLALDEEISAWRPNVGIWFNLQPPAVDA